MWIARGHSPPGRGGEGCAQASQSPSMLGDSGDGMTFRDALQVKLFDVRGGVAL